MDAGPAITVSDLSKVFKVPTERRQSLKQHFTGLLRPVGYRRHEALRGVTFTVDHGEFFSIIGHNGSGKSTLLKILAGIYQPTEGSVSVSGRLSPFIELGVGFNPELTARENVYLNGVILGLTRPEVDREFDSIIKFAELEDFVDQRLKNFSSGMLVRLAFSVAIRAHSGILLIDEVLAVGDANFQQKCFDVFRRMKAERKTVVFVSHDLGSVQEFSDRVLVLDGGEARGTLTPGRAVTLYKRLMEERANAEMARADSGQEVPSEHSEHPTLRSVELLSEGKATHVLHRWDNPIVRVVIDNPQTEPVGAGVSLVRTDGIYCFGTNTFLAGIDPVCHPQITCELKLDHLQLQQGTYYIVVGVFGAQESTIHEFHDRAYDFEVTHPDEYGGLLYLDHSWRVMPS
ncbi:MAG: ABC transporter ATP-binding protein [Acidimicrobiaceae bacterium]|nr:ABC transporter ATP-binding protein [Acidimicrobiaceae bacterium]